MGTYKTKDDKKLAPRFSGLGLYSLTEAELRARLKAGYIEDMNPPRTKAAHTIADTDIKGNRDIQGSWLWAQDELAGCDFRS